MAKNGKSTILVHKKYHINSEFWRDIMEKITQKKFNFTEIECSKFNKIKMDLGYKTDNKVLAYLINSYEERETMVDTLTTKIDKMFEEKMEGKLKKTFERIRFSSTASERYGYVLLDIMNTLLFDFPKADVLLPANGETKHKMVAESQFNLSKMIEARKQTRDNEQQKKENINRESYK